jgi:hypothetical protein
MESLKEKLAALEVLRDDYQTQIKAIIAKIIEAEAEFKKGEVVEVFEYSGAGSWKNRKSLGLAKIEARFFSRAAGFSYWAQPCTKAGKRIDRRRFFDSGLIWFKFEAVK